MTETRGRRNSLIGSLVFCAVLLLPGQGFAADNVLRDAQMQREDGHLLAERQCSTCHAIGRKGASPRPDAPVFRTILRRYRADVLEQELVEGIKLGHPDMPLFQLNPAAVDDLIAYLKSIQQRPKSRKKPVGSAPTP
ncbi:MAG: c-type cytochrome [Alphaproteobacteria bacterium]|nr:c-type cytochrome [Alphaproteobacteria bacterium]